MSRPWSLVAGALCLVIVAGCDSGLINNRNPPGFTAEEYQYKGVADPLLQTSGGDRAGALADRFELVQGRE